MIIGVLLKGRYPALSMPLIGCVTSCAKAEPVASAKTTIGRAPTLRQKGTSGLLTCCFTSQSKWQGDLPGWLGPPHRTLSPRIANMGRAVTFP